MESKLLKADFLKLGEPLRDHTTFQVGGPCAYFFAPQREEDFARVQDFVKETGLPFYVLGKGSNILADDRGFAGVILSTQSLPQHMKIEKAQEGILLEADGGSSLEAVCAFAADHGCQGLEFACGIPGSIGGAVVMNAGAYGGEIQDVLYQAKVLEADGLCHWAEAEALELGYRKSNILSLGRIVLGVRFLLQEGKPKEIWALMEELNQKRRDKQPLEYPSAGSTFKRPEGYFAGKLIDDAGLRGYRLGGAAVSSKHCGFIINENHATSRDIKDLIAHVQKQVFEKFGVELECEVRMI